MTDETRKKIIKALRAGATKMEIAKLANIHRRTLYNHLDDKDMQMAIEYNKAYIINIFES